MFNHRPRTFLLVLFILVLMLLTGCVKTKDGEFRKPQINGDSVAPPGTPTFPPSEYPGDPVSIELPMAFQNMMAAQPQRTFYIGTAMHGASDKNDCSAPESSGGSKGPCETLSVLREKSIRAGDHILVRGGTYDFGSTSTTMKFYGSEDSPVVLKAYPGEQPKFDLTGVFDKSVMTIGGAYFMIEGIEFLCPDSPPKPLGLQCTTIFTKDIAHHIILKNNVFRNALEDGIKTTTESEHLLIYQNEFVGTHGEGESIDVFGADHVWVVENEFHHNTIGLRDPGVEMWAKGGAYDVWFVNNYFHDLTVDPYALILGGCCWNNWDGRNADGSVKPVAEEVHAVGNIFENIEVVGSYQYKATLGIEGCKNCEYRNNVVRDATVGLGIRPTQQDRDFKAPSNILVENNTFINIESGVLVAIHKDLFSGISILNNEFYTDGPTTCKLGGQDKTFDDLKGLGYGDVGTIFPEADYRE